MSVSNLCLTRYYFCDTESIICWKRSRRNFPEEFLKLPYKSAPGFTSDHILFKATIFLYSLSPREPQGRAEICFHLLDRCSHHGQGPRGRHAKVPRTRCDVDRELLPLEFSFMNAAIRRHQRVNGADGPADTPLGFHSVVTPQAGVETVRQMTTCSGRRDGNEFWQDLAIYAVSRPIYISVH